MKPIARKEKINAWFVVIMLLIASLSITLGVIFYPSLADATAYREGFPDIILCTGVASDPLNATLVYQYVYQDWDGNFQPGEEEGTYYEVQPDVGSSYKFALGYDTSGDLILDSGVSTFDISWDCDNKTIATLYADNQAFDYSYGESSSSTETTFEGVTGEQFAMVAGASFFFVTIFTLFYAFRGK